jgi:LmbE family N-acetylglucosaminyl deacetylase
MIMKLKNKNIEVFIPDNKPMEEAILRTTHIGIAAHQDDLEIMAYDGILKCFGSDKNWFLGIIVTDGRGSPRNGLYKNYSDKEMIQIRKQEQKKASIVGEYGALIFLNYSSSKIKEHKNKNLKEDIEEIVILSRPSVVYTHNLADKHDTHVCVGLRTIQALRDIPGSLKPEFVYGCEVWKDLDWMIDKDKIIFDVSDRQNLALALLGIFDSQICGGKRYDLASIGRRRANATYYKSHNTDNSSSLIYAMDLTPLIKKPDLSITQYIKDYIKKFSLEVSEKIEKLME